MSIKAGIKTTVIDFSGRQGTIHDMSQVFDQFNLRANFIVKGLGDLREPFRVIGNHLTDKIQTGFRVGSYGSKPKAKFTLQAREARGGNEETPALLSTGRLMRSIRPVPARRDGRHLTLRVSSIGVPYAVSMIFGDDWQVPVREFLTPQGNLLRAFDPDRLDGAIMTGEEFYGDEWERISKWDEAWVTVSVPARNFLTFDEEDIWFINSVMEEYLQRAMREMNDKGVVPF